MLALRRVVMAAARRGGFRAAPRYMRVLAARQQPQLAARAFSSDSSDKKKDDERSSSSKKDFGGGIGGWFRSQLATFVGAVQQKQLTTTLHSLTNRYKRMNKLLERLATDASTKHMASDLESITAEVKERLDLLQRTGTAVSGATADQWTDRSVTKPWERVVVDTLKLVGVHEKQMRMTLMRLAMRAGSTAVASGTDRRKAIEDAANLIERAAKRESDADAADAKDQRQVKSTSAETKGKERQWIQSATGADSTAPDAKAEPALGSVLSDIFGADAAAAAKKAKDDKSKETPATQAKTTTAAAEPVSSDAAPASTAVPASAAASAVDAVKQKLQTMQSRLETELPAWLRLYHTYSTSASAVAKRDAVKVQLQQEITALEERLNELADPARAWSIVSQAAVRGLVDERLQHNVLAVLGPALRPAVTVGPDATVQLEQLTGLSERDFLEGARMAYQTLVREFNRANTDPDYDFDSDRVLTTDPLRKFMQQRINRWRELGLQSQVSIANALLPGDFTLPPTREAASQRTGGQIPAPTSLISPMIRAELLSCIAATPVSHIPNPTGILRSMWSASRDPDPSKREQAEQQLDAALLSADAIVTAYKTRTVRVLVSVLIGADEMVHLDAAFPPKVRDALLASRQAEEDREQRALNSRPASVPLPSAAQPFVLSVSSSSSSSSSSSNDDGADTERVPGATFSKTAHRHVWTFMTTVALQPDAAADAVTFPDKTAVAPSVADLTWRVCDMNGCVGLLPDWQAAAAAITDGNDA